MGVTARDPPERAAALRLWLRAVSDGRTARALFEQAYDEGIVLALLRAVANFEDVKKPRHVLDKFSDARRIRKAMKKMIEDVDKAFGAEVGHERVAVAAQMLNFAMLCFRQAIDADVDLVPEARKKRRRFFTHDEIGQGADAVKELQAAVN